LKTIVDSENPKSFSVFVYDKDVTLCHFKHFMKYMNNLLGIVLIRAYRVQHWKGKQNKTQKKKIDGSAMIANFLYFKNIYCI